VQVAWGNAIFAIANMPPLSVMNSNGFFFYASLGQAFSKINTHNSRDASMMQVLLVHWAHVSGSPA
jgi:hypothetical protein